MSRLTRPTDPTTSVILCALATVSFASSVMIDSAWRFVPLAIGFVLLMVAVVGLRRSPDRNSNPASGRAPGGWLPSREAKADRDPREVDQP